MQAAEDVTDRRPAPPGTPGLPRRALRALQIGVSAAAATMLLASGLEPRLYAPDPFDGVAYPVMAVLLTLLAGMAWLRPARLPVAVCGTAAVGAAYLLVRLGYGLFAVAPGLPGALLVAETLLWIPVLHALGLMLPWRAGRWISAGFATAVLGLSVAYAVLVRPVPYLHGLVQLNLANLILALVAFAIVRARVSAELRERAVIRDALTDPLTGLPNRRRLERELEAAVERRRPLGVLFIDLDGFKAVNDAHGHDAGDRLLRAVGARLRRAVRDHAVVARLGGDEFVVALPEARRGELETVGRRLLDTLQEPFEVDGVTHALGASVGCSVYPDDARDATTLLRHADAAMYRVKRGGRNGVALYGGGTLE